MTCRYVFKQNFISKAILQKSTNSTCRGNKKEVSGKVAKPVFNFRVNLVYSLFLVGHTHWLAWIGTKTNKKKMSARKDAIALFRPHSPMNRGQRCNVDLLHMLHCRLRQCRNSTGSSARLSFLTFTFARWSKLGSCGSNDKDRRSSEESHHGRQWRVIWSVSAPATSS